MRGSTFLAAQESAPDPRFVAAGPVRAPFDDVMAARFGSAVSAGPGIGLFRWMRRELDTLRAQGIDPSDMSQRAPDADAEKLLTPEDANARFGIEGRVSFTRPIAESAARELRDIARRDAVRADAIARARGGAAEWTAGMGAMLLGGAIDPLNVASAFVPVVSAARAAAWLGQAGSRLGRIGVAARIGAIEGAAGGAMLTPVNAFVQRQENRDYGMVEALLDVAFGAVLGAMLHSGGRAVVDALRGWHGPDGHEAMVRAAVAQVARGEPVNVAALGRLWQEARREELLRAASFARRAPDGSAWAFDLPTVQTPDAPPLGARIGAWLDTQPARRAPPQELAPVLAPERGQDGQPIRYADAGTARRGQRWEWEQVEPDVDGRGFVRLTPVQAEVLRDAMGSVRRFGSETEAVQALVDMRAGEGVKLETIAPDDYRPVPVGPAETAPYILARGADAEIDRLRRSRGLVALPRGIDGPVPMSSAETRALVQQAVRASAFPARDIQGIADARLAAAQARAGVDAAPTGEPPDLRQAAEIDRHIAELDPMLRAQDAAGRLSAEDRAAIEAADATVTEATQRARAWDAAAACLFANGG